MSNLDKLENLVDEEFDENESGTDFEEEKEGDEVTDQEAELFTSSDEDYRDSISF